MKPNIRTLNSLIISIILNVIMLFLLVWLFQTEEKPAEEAIEISIISMPFKRQHSPTTSKRMIGQASTSYSSRHAIVPSSVIPNSEFRIPNSSNQASLPVLTASHLKGKLDSSFPIDSGTLQQGITMDNISLGTHGQGRSWYFQGGGAKQSDSWQDGLLKEMTEPPLAQVEGSGKSISGYFNISQVKYEDTSDIIRTTALRHLAAAMNRWTMIETKVLPDPINLDEKEIFRVPLIYIASRSALLCALCSSTLLLIDALMSPTHKQLFPHKPKGVGELTKNDKICEITFTTAAFCYSQIFLMNRC